VALRRLLLVLPGTSYRAEAFARAARALDVELVLGSDLPQAFSKLGCPTLAFDLGHPERAAELLANETVRFDGVLGSDEGSALVAAHAARAMGLPHHDPDGVRATRDKRLMREKLAACGVAQPRMRVLEPDEPPEVAGERAELPCVVKAPMLSGSQGVIRADDSAGVVRAVARVRAILARHPSPWREHADFHRLLLEQYVAGVEIAVEGLVDQGTLEVLAVFDKPDPLVGPYFEETLYVTPSRHAPALLESAISLTSSAALGLGLRHGPIHAELRLSPEGPRLIEIAPRSIGGLCSKTFELFADNLEELLIAHNLGLPRRPSSGARHRAAGVMMIPIPKSGVLREVRGVERALQVPGVAGVTISSRPGDALRTLPDGSSYLGFLFAGGDSAESVESSLRAAHRELEFDLAPLLDLG
jgi:biotin carboxylase